MAVLKNKTYRKYDYLSRYSNFPYYYHSLDNKYIYGVTSQLKTDGVNYVLHEIKEEDTLDSLSFKYFGRPDYFWVIADFNQIQDPYIDLFHSKYKTLKIPSLQNISFK